MDIRWRVVRIYTRVAAVVLVGVGLLGATNVLEFRSAVNISHLVAGLMYTYLGFLQRDEVTLRFMLAGMGLLLLASKLVLIVSPLFVGAPSLRGPIEITCVLIGLLSLWAFWYTRSSRVS